MENNNLLAAVDLGSNSFRLSVGRIEERNGEAHVFAIDRLKETVRLAAGLDDNKILSDEAIQRAVGVLKRFSERIQDFHPSQVRAIATNTFRVAKNREILLQKRRYLLQEFGTFRYVLRRIKLRKSIAVSFNASSIINFREINNGTKTLSATSNKRPVFVSGTCTGNQRC